MSHVFDVVVKYNHCSTVEWHKKAAYSPPHTIVSLDFGSMALLQYSGHPYNTGFHMAIAVYGMESPSKNSS